MALEEMIASLRALKRIAERTAELAAPLLEAAVKATAGAGQSPDGKTWAPTKKGRQAMVNAASHITTKAFGNVVRMVLTGADVFHHFSKKTGEPRRQVIPDAGTSMPAVVAEALARASARAFKELTGG